MVVGKFTFKFPCMCNHLQVVSQQTYPVLCRNRALRIFIPTSYTSEDMLIRYIPPTMPFWFTHLLKYYQWVSNATFKVHVTTNIIISADTDSLFHRECSKPPVACQDDSHRVVYISSFSHSHEYQPLGRWCEPRCDSWCSVSSDGLMSIHHTVDRDSPYIGTVLLPSV